eukprot:g3059.t1
MDTGKSFSEKIISREPIERIQRIQKEIQANLKKTGAIHLVAKNDRITSVIIPSAMLAIAIPMIGYGLYSIATQPAPNN